MTETTEVNELESNGGINLIWKFVFLLFISIFMSTITIAFFIEIDSYGFSVFSVKWSLIDGFYKDIIRVVVLIAASFLGLIFIISGTDLIERLFSKLLWLIGASILSTIAVSLLATQLNWNVRE